MKIFIFLFIIILILVRFFLQKPNFKNGDTIRITARVLSEPLVFSTSQYLTLEGIKMYLPKIPEITYGDKVVVEGKVDGNKLINAKLIEFKVKKAGFLYKFRNSLIKYYKRILPEPYSSLIAGTVIGSKNMPEDFWNKLKATGTAHVVVASGTNVTLTAGFLLSISTYFLKRKKAIWICLVGIIIYIVLSGFDAPIVRAGIMGAILFIAQEKGRLVSAWRLLFLTGLIMLLIKPIWITDLGFILSFVATASLMLFQKRINSLLKFVPNILREGLSTSLAAQIGVAPIIYATFGQFNIFSPLINALVLWTIPYIMILGAIGGIVGLVIPILGKVILLIAFPLVWWFVGIVNLF
ncbi:hypothetical protein A2422_00040 [Candidatus Woesebacteria bacterium RIFOXYC1_FULL_31_51]|uniref:Competence protein ComEC n=1 Tax=Candidatus Woesebacteria bacterium GW2011_GWC2_31_9 TaxID=1618586 RepID=A0A0F9YXP5_9BACT|nr:MAG: competence protein ComEC, competence protein ComEC [Candidatus Woesebacteria bacterium GW2011_GWF1_31_35]KKP23050.1 MAG: Competence protein ComEC [Candidatus Woesebacteria bacterium GW2011_GWC1_30_29]KKP25340.1 MAG: Competence protein ComEC [Candidatus Woesebacteria bacterium GW2011_GWD1_31_12]KKP27292.1 MAG: Competence protein ComEC [Candidatus Woesebacteria bacterium GW2011_GWB1_31_29]KKP31221.1 MAG: Competence protein ComEC [Candidatus Woesebacteria bacterium GW2011_GWC2_31_9]KKP327